MLSRRGEAGLFVQRLELALAPPRGLVALARRESRHELQQVVHYARAATNQHYSVKKQRAIARAIIILESLAYGTLPHRK